ncbi:MAG: hypothetical protein RLZZ189_1430 [Pseudomonadota bacterium]|jgi:hypothetical protein
MRKFNSPVNLKAAADSFVSEAYIDVTLTELVSAHSIARPLLALHFRLKKWCDLVNGFGAECAWSISSERLQSAVTCSLPAVPNCVGKNYRFISLSGKKA